ncbi:MAG: galactose ABC transporter substrate-binding protein [Ndongobacter sp.]|nr:galactose ABC transporter substrate-binding protein [Ndongobacter sp.]
MKKMKKVWAALLALTMVLSLAACGGQKKEESSAAESSTEESTTASESSSEEASQETPATGKTYNIGVAIYQYNDNFMTLYRNELESYFAELGKADGNTYNVEFQDGKNDQATQTEQLNNFIAQGKDLIIANLVDPTGADTIIDAAKAANIPVVLINREPKSTETMERWPGKVTYVGVDARQSGVYQGEIIAELENHGDINGDGKVSYLMIMGDAGNVDAEQRTQYSVETLQKTIPAESLGEPQRGNWDEAKGQEIAANALSQYGMDLEVIFSNNDGMAKGAKTAIDAAGRKVNEDIYIVGVDALPEVVEMLDKGEFTGTVLNDHFNQAHTAAEAAVKLLQGEEVKPYIWHDYVKVLKAADAELKRLPSREETVEEYTKRLEETYGQK